MASPSVFGMVELAHRVEELETRVRKLEDCLAGKSAPESEIKIQPIPERASGVDFQDAGPLVPLVGKALLVLAGAYLLRALTTSSFAPAWAGIALALGYALFWMFRAIRVGKSNELAGSVYMTTAVLAFSPMLWETTVRFHIMSSGLAALTLSGFVVLSLLLSWQPRLHAIGWLAASAGVITALTLSFRTYDLLPFCGALLLMAATLEAAAFQDLWLGPRRMVGVAADFTVLWFVYIHAPGFNVPEGYQAIPGALQWWAIPGTLLLIYAAGVTARTVIRNLDVTAFEVFQLLVSSTLFVYAAGRTQNHLPLDVVLVCCGAACYWISFVRLKGAPHSRNVYVYSALGLAFALLGTSLSLPPSWKSIVWALMAAGLAALAARTRRPAITWHALAFLAAVFIGSGLAQDTFSVLLRDGTDVALTPAVLFALAATIGGYVVLRPDIPRAIVATMLAWVIVAGAVSLVLSGLPRSADAVWRDEIRTVSLVVTAIVIAGIGRHWRRTELYWLVPGAMIVALYRLLAEDLPVGRPETLAVSLLSYGGALVLLSGFMRRWRRESSVEITLRAEGLE
jgi:hypothetical protein